MTKTFAERFAARTVEHPVALMISPKLLQMPVLIQRYDDPFLPFSKSLIHATHDLVCAYLFDFAAYFSIGAAGVVAMERAIAYVVAMGDIRPLTILHAPFASNGYVEAVSDKALWVDGVTVYDATHAPAYEALLPGGVFVANEQAAGLPRFDVNRRMLTYPYMGQFFQVRVLGDDAVYADQRETFPDGVRRYVQTTVQATENP